MLAGSLTPPDRSHVYWNGTFSDSEKRRLVPDALPGALNVMLGDLRAQLGRNGNARDLNAFIAKTNAEGGVYEASANAKMILPLVTLIIIWPASG